MVKETVEVVSPQEGVNVNSGNNGCSSISENLTGDKTKTVDVEDSSTETLNTIDNTLLTVNDATSSSVNNKESSITESESCNENILTKTSGNMTEKPDLTKQSNSGIKAHTEIAQSISSVNDISEDNNIADKPTFTNLVISDMNADGDPSVPEKSDSCKDLDKEKKQPADNSALTNGSDDDKEHEENETQVMIKDIEKTDLHVSKPEQNKAKEALTCDQENETQIMKKDVEKTDNKCDETDVSCTSQNKPKEALMCGKDPAANRPDKISTLDSETSKPLDSVDKEEVDSSEPTNELVVKDAIVTTETTDEHGPKPDTCDQNDTLCTSQNKAKEALMCDQDPATNIPNRISNLDSESNDDNKKHEDDETQIIKKDTGKPEEHVSKPDTHDLTDALCASQNEAKEALMCDQDPATNRPDKISNLDSESKPSEHVVIEEVECYKPTNELEVKDVIVTTESDKQSDDKQQEQNSCQETENAKSFKNTEGSTKKKSNVLPNKLEQDSSSSEDDDTALVIDLDKGKKGTKGENKAKQSKNNNLEGLQSMKEKDVKKGVKDAVKLKKIDEKIKESSKGMKSKMKTSSTDDQSSLKQSKNTISEDLQFQNEKDEKKSIKDAVKDKNVDENIKESSKDTKSKVKPSSTDDQSSLKQAKNKNVEDLQSQNEKDVKKYTTTPKKIDKKIRPKESLKDAKSKVNVSSNDNQTSPDSSASSVISPENAKPTQSRYGRVHKKKSLDMSPERTPMSPPAKSPGVKMESTPGSLSVEEMEKLCPVELAVGDVLWAKCTGHPWWPGVVTVDPDGNDFSKIQGSSKKGYRKYHIQFFGPGGYRGWISSQCYMKFDGKTSLKTMLTDSSKHKVSDMPVFGKKKNLESAWDEACVEAGRALLLEANDRVSKYKKVESESLIFEHINPSPSPKKRNSEKKVPDSPLKSPRSAKKVTVDSDSDEDVPPPAESDSDDETPRKQKAKKKPKRTSNPGTKVKKNDFSYFCYYMTLRTSEMKLDFPEMKEGEIQTLLIQNWRSMKDQDKALYKPEEKTAYRPKNTMDTASLEKLYSREVVGNGGSKKQLPIPAKYKEKQVSPKYEKNKTESPKQAELETPIKKKRGRPSKTDQETESPKHKERKIELDELDSPLKKKRGRPSKTEIDTISPEEKKLKTELDSPYNKKRGRPSKTETVTKSPKEKEEKGVRDSYSDKKRGRPSKDERKEVMSPKADKKTPQQSKGLSEVKASSSRKRPASPRESESESSTKRVKTSLDLLTPSSLMLSLMDSKNGTDKADKICRTCEKLVNQDKMVKCDGACCGYFHPLCVGLETPKNVFKCENCKSGKQHCFVCKVVDSKVRCCTVKHCGRFYHETCVRTYRGARVDSKGVTCSLHACAACSQNGEHGSSSKGRLLKCVRCPTSYHPTIQCLAAGTEVLSNTLMICPNHLQPNKTNKNNSHINVYWCFICANGGSLICCERCPAAFHTECLKIGQPEGSFYCHDCVQRRQPKYGDIVWAKVFKYRWWPAQIYHPRNIPENIIKLPHRLGEFPVRFFGSNDYYWTHRERVFAFEEGDKGRKDNTSLAKIFNKALEEANEAFKDWKAKKDSDEASQTAKNSKKPPSYKHIKANRAFGKVQLGTSDPSESEVTACDCNPKSEQPCGEKSDCLNRMMMLECDPSVCHAGDRCGNQRMQRREYAPTTPFKTEARGWGLQALENIKKGQFVSEYVGEVIDEEEFKLRMREMNEANTNNNFYFLTIDKDRIIDAGPKGNLSRFMNHCCKPNCETQKWTAGGETRVGLFAMHDIPAGTEVTFNYNLDCRGNEKTKCRCGADNCSGFIGLRPKSLPVVTKSEKKLKKRGRKPHKDDKKPERSGGEEKHRKAPSSQKKKSSGGQGVTSVVWQDNTECFKCKKNGDLVMCSSKNCFQSYHLKCLDLVEPPAGKWECPWHSCDICQKRALMLCTMCPNSFCAPHAEGNLYACEDGSFRCEEHYVNQEAQQSQE